MPRERGEPFHRVKRNERGNSPKDRSPHDYRSARSEATEAEAGAAEEVRLPVALAADSRFIGRWRLVSLAERLYAFNLSGRGRKRRQERRWRSEERRVGKEC